MTYGEPAQASRGPRTPAATPAHPGPGSCEADGRDRIRAEARHLAVPKLLAFYQDAWDDSGTAVGWRTVAWGLALADGSAISIPVDPPTTVTWWHSVDDAAAALDAYVDAPAPRRWVAASTPGVPDGGLS